MALSTSPSDLLKRIRGEVPVPVTTGLDHHERMEQVVLRVAIKNPPQLVVHGVESGGCQPKVDDSG